MLNFIICDDNVDFANHIQTLVTKFMMNYDVEYKIHVFNKYDKKFNEIAKQDMGFKIYMLDIENEKTSGLDAARMIREELDDWLSLIVIITAYNEYKYDALSNRLFLLDFINKLYDCDNKVIEILKIAMKSYNNKHKCLSYEYNHVIKRIDFSHIIYIEKEQDSKRCIVKTTYGDFLINKNLNETFKLLDNRFFKSSRSMIINLEQVHEYNIQDSKIIFKNGIITHQIARDKKKELKGKV